MIKTCNCILTSVTGAKEIEQPNQHQMNFSLQSFIAISFNVQICAVIGLISRASLMNKKKGNLIFHILQLQIAPFFIKDIQGHHFIPVPSHCEHLRHF